MSTLHCVPPAPEIMAMLYMDYRRARAYKKMSFRQYLESIGYTDPAADIVGMDDAAQLKHVRAGLELIEVPSKPVTGKLRVKVLLVDFADRPGTLAKQHYEDLLFSKGVFPTGSMRDFYQEVSLTKVDINGSVHGWLRMPNPYSFYTNGKSGTGKAYPNNAQRLAEDAVNAAIANGVAFEPDLDKLNQGVVTALFIVHAGRGAEVMPPALRGGEIWSHKWVMRNPVQAGPNLQAAIYLTVPNDCKVGVCAHELGHLAFQWQDFYDPNYNEDGHEWDGSGSWDLMAGGSYNGNGDRPAHPAGLHKLQHGWVNLTTVNKARTLTIQPYKPKSGRVYKVVSPNYELKQYLILENRKRSGFDFDLPAEGLLVWRVDESAEQEAPDQPGMLLIQADGQHDLEKPDDWNEGDAGDPFPGSRKRTDLGDTGSLSTTFPGGARSGVTLKNIRRDPATGVIKLSVAFAAAAPKPSKGAKRKTGSKAKKRKPK